MLSDRSFLVAVLVVAFTKGLSDVRPRKWGGGGGGGGAGELRGGGGGGGQDESNLNRTLSVCPNSLLVF